MQKSEKSVSRLAGKKGRRFERQLLLLRELIREPRDMGTVFPSSPVLADEMASALSPSLLRDGVFVELGAGTGPVTEAMLRHGIPAERLYAVEKSRLLADELTKRFPGINVLCCGAEELRDFIRSDAPVKAVVSSLPFRSLPQDVGAAIMREIECVLAPGGFYIQFTYALIGEMPYVPSGFRKLRSHFVLYNIPPAKVEVFRKPKGRGSISNFGVD